MKRQRYSNECKVQVVKEVLEVGNRSAMARRYEIANNVLYRWIREYQQGRFNDVDQTVPIHRNIAEVTRENDPLKQ